MKNVKELVEKYIFIAVMVCLLVAVVSLMFTLKNINDYNAAVADIFDGNKDLISKMSEIERLRNEYGIYGEPDEAVSEYYALNGYMTGFNDKYARYSDKAETSTSISNDAGEGIGMGVSVVYEQDGLYVADVYEGSAAYNAGVHIGDLITSVNGVKYNASDNSEFNSELRGNVGDIIKVELTRDGNVENLDLELANFTINPVSSDTSDKTVAYVKISDFNELTDDEFSKQMTELKKQGYSKYILDLRNNHGGLYDSVVNMIDFVCPKGLITRVEYGNGEVSEEYSDAKEFTGDIVILVNGETASASELFSQSLKDFGKAYIIGTNTYGKGTVLQTFMLNDGTSVTLSTGRYLSHGLVNVDDVGVQVDEIVELSNDKLATLYKLDKADDEQYLAAYNYIINK